MGTNKRYASQLDARMDTRIVERAAAAGPLQSLSEAELALDRHPLTVDPQPKPVRAWVRFGATPVLVDAVAARWTPRAVGIRFAVAGHEHRAWVWSSAVEQADPPRL